MAEVDLQLLRRLQRDAADVLDNRARAQDAVARAAAEMKFALEDATRLALEDRRDEADAAMERFARAEAARDEERERIAALDERWRDLIGRFTAFDSADADAAVPLVLLPVRIETMYARDQHANERVRAGDLLIRVFPDDVHIDELERGLDDAEREPGRQYWRAAWQGTGGTADADAWSRLIEVVGKERAGYVAYATTPSEVDGQLVFPEIGPRRRSPAVARLLPDRFTATALVGGQTLRATGTFVNPEVVVGLLRDDADTAPPAAEETEVPQGTEWLLNFDRAREAGLAIELRLPQPFARVDRLFVTGVRGSLDPARASRELESLLYAHRLSRGLAVVPQGTPTNNTETDRAAWQQAPDPAKPARKSPAPGSNASLLADALGVAPAVFSGLGGADRQDQADARAVNVSLWHATWGPFLDRIDKLSTEVKLTDSGRETIRRTFRDFVRGGGPLPSVRIGSQPYAVLPAASLDANVWRDRDDLERQFLKYLRPLQQHWTQLAAALKTVASNDPIDEVMRDILGCSAVSFAVLVRPVLGSEAAALLHSTVDEDDAPDIAQLLIQRMVLEYFGQFKFRPQASFGSLGEERALRLPIVHDSDPEYIAALIHPALIRPAEKSVFQALLALAWAEAEKERDAGGSAGSVGKAVEYATTLTPEMRQRATALAGADTQASSQSLHAFADQVASVTGAAGPSLLAKFQPVEKFKTSFSDLALDSTSAVARDTFAGAAVAAWARGNARLAELREALERLRTSPGTTRERGILVAQTLDLASHRLDAWLTAIVERRRQATRQQTPSGAAIGAYGWVEGIERAAPDDQSGGYIHAPTLNHARTAGLLRNAHLSHRRSAAGSNAFEIDLTSARVRTAVEILEGVRLGQPIGALIGYRIEREIRERARGVTLRALPRVILSLRDVAPLAARQLTDHGTSGGSASSEFVAAGNVVDGVRLLELWAGNKTQVVNSLNAKPENNPYIVGAWKPPTAEEWAVLAAIFKEAAGIVDAAADLLLAESVHQLSQGNTSAAAAALDALGGGDALTPQPDVVRTPPRGVTFAHRVLVCLPAEGDVADAGWNAARPRAQASPALERWAVRRLGPAGDIRLLARDDGTWWTMADAGLAALDFVFEADRPDRLEQRIRFAIPDIDPEASLARERGGGWPDASQPFERMVALAGSIRSVLAESRVARPADFSRSGEPVLRTVGAASLQDADVRLRAGIDGLRAGSAQLADLLDAFAAGAADAVQIRLVLEQLAAYGVVVPIVAEEQLTAVAHLAAGEARRRADEADAVFAAGGDAAEVANRVARTIFGDGFLVVHAIDAPPTPDTMAIALAAGRPQPAPSRPQVRRFLRTIASVRGAMADYAEAMHVGDALGRSVVHQVVQIGAAPPHGPDEWVGGPLDTTRFTPGGSVANLVLEGAAALGQPIEAIVVDEWTDTVPAGAGSTADVDASTRASRATGLALNAPAASSSAPQAILLAVSPDGERWTTDTLVATLDHTLRLAKLRAVTLEQTGGTGAVLPAIYAQSAALQGVTLDLASTVAELDTSVLYIKEVGQ